MNVLTFIVANGQILKKHKHLVTLGPLDNCFIIHFVDVSACDEIVMLAPERKHT